MYSFLKVVSSNECNVVICIIKKLTNSSKRDFQEKDEVNEYIAITLVRKTCTIKIRLKSIKVEQRNVMSQVHDLVLN